MIDITASLSWRLRAATNVSGKRPNAIGSTVLFGWRGAARFR
jgi:hypothetical protein